MSAIALRRLVEWWIEEFDTDSAVADEARGLIEYRLPADLILLLSPISRDPGKDEVKEGLARVDAGLQRSPLILVPAAGIAWRRSKTMIASAPNFAFSTRPRCSYSKTTVLR